MRRAKSSTKRASGTQIPLSTGYQWLPDRPSDHPPKITNTPVLTGIRTYDRTAAPTGTHSPLMGVSTSLELSSVGFGVRRVKLEDQSLECREVLALRASLLPLLPASVSLCGVTDSKPLALTITTSRAVWMALRRLRRVVFGIQEWSALVSGCEDDRASPYHLIQWCEAKTRRPTWKVNELDTIGQLPKTSRRAGWGASVGQVLDGWGIELRAVHVGAVVPDA
jgi:hypothetical protein